MHFGYGKIIHSGTSWKEIKSQILESHRNSPYKQVKITPNRSAPSLSFGSYDGKQMAECHLDIHCDLGPNAREYDLHSCIARVRTAVFDSGEIGITVQTRYNQA